MPCRSLHSTRTRSTPRSARSVIASTHPSNVLIQTLCCSDATCPRVLLPQDGDRALVDRAGTAVVLLGGSAHHRIPDRSGAGGRAASAATAAGRARSRCGGADLGGL